MPKRNSPTVPHKKKNVAKHVLAAAQRKKDEAQTAAPTGDAMVAEKVDGSNGTSSPSKQVSASKSQRTIPVSVLRISDLHSGIL